MNEVANKIANRIYTLATAAVLCCVAATSAQNMITNPGFESSGSGYNLFTQSGSPAVASVTYPTTGAHGGTRYARVVVTTPSETAAENWHVHFQPPTGWTAAIGATYEFKFWAKTDSNANIHVSVQGADYTYLTGTSFGLTPDWTEYSLTYVSEAEGTNAVRFHIYVAESVNAYSFDDVSVTTVATGIRGSAPAQANALRLHQGSDHLVLTVDGNVSGSLKAEVLDLRGTSLASATGSAEGSMRLALPKESGTYFIRAQTRTHSWVRAVRVP